MSGLVIGLSGKRSVGKSKVADCLVRDHGFQRIHPFDGGKAAAFGYFVHIGISPDDAERMVNGDLKDIPCPLLPDSVAPRFFLEKFGKFMGTGMGPEWTIGQELRLARERNPDARLIAESIVYEVDVLREMGGFIVEIRRDCDEKKIEGIETDKATSSIIPDMIWENNGKDLSLLGGDVSAMLRDVINEMSSRTKTPEPF